MSSRRRSKRLNTMVTWVAVAVALVVHGAAVGTVDELGLSLVGKAFSSTTDPTHLKDKAALAEDCKLNAALASGARYSLCYAPWRGDLEACVAESEQRMWMDLSGCSAQPQDIVDTQTVAMISPEEQEKLKPIDPEPLLEQLEQPKPPDPPKDVPKPQPQEQPPPQPKPPAPPPPQRPQQVVETAKPTDEQAPDNARFLAEYNTKVEKQTVARGSVQEPMVAKSKAAELTPTNDPREASVQEHPDRDHGRNEKAPDVPGTLSMRSPGSQTPADEAQEAKTRGDLAGSMAKVGFDGYMARRGNAALEQQRRDKTELPRGQNGAGGGMPDVPNLKPSQEVLERIAGGGNVDHLDDVDNGDETALSAKRWVYASFFNRMKRQVAQNWDPASVWRRQDPTGQVYGFKTRVTEVRVSLNTKGELAKIVVVTPSGVNELDDEAVRAFQSAAPFPNPPGELAEKDNLITFGFSFYFEIGTPRSSWRVVRSM
jgi:TonB family protein